MLIKEYFRMAIDSIRTNKMRALLTMLGIIIGIASVITIIAAGDGVRAYMNSQLEAVGTNTVIVSPMMTWRPCRTMNWSGRSHLRLWALALPTSANPPWAPRSMPVPREWKLPAVSAW